jgi:hypothetical protein
VGGAAIPRDDGVAGPGLGVEALEPGGGLVGGERLFGEALGVAVGAIGLFDSDGRDGMG